MSYVRFGGGNIEAHYGDRARTVYLCAADEESMEIQIGDLPELIAALTLIMAADDALYGDDGRPLDDVDLKRVDL